jgi:tRNA pseudouridine55 synthase
LENQYLTGPSEVSRQDRASSGSCCDGIVLVDKNEGETSFDVVRKAKRLLKRKKVGHSGTLDPFATGLLIILLGQGTKLSSYLMSGKKRYLATMTLGIGTDTLDKTGRIVETVPVPALDPQEIRRIIQGFIGDIEQTPPAYSAININGQRAYKLARQGIAVDLKKRTVTIHSIDILSIDLPDITFEVTCSCGTYVRSLAADIGERLGLAAHLSSLRRLSSGTFEVQNAFCSSMMGNAENVDIITDRIMSLKDALPEIKECCIDDETARKITNGYRPVWHEVACWGPSLDDYKGYIKLTNGPSLVAIMELDRSLGDRREWLKNIRVFAQ